LIVLADWPRRLAAAPGPGADGDVVPIGDPDEDEGYGDDEDDDDDDDEDEDEEEPWQVADTAIDTCESAGRVPGCGAKVNVRAVASIAH
jgi:hypothetical protein